MEFDDYFAAQRAIRDILFMYRFLAGYRGLYCDFGWEDGEFDPLAYIDTADHPNLDPDDVRLLREGSAIKVLCYVLQAYGQGGYPMHEPGRSGLVLTNVFGWPIGDVSATGGAVWG